MKKFVLAPLAVLAVILGFTVALASSASATHPQVSGTADCDSITWTVTGDPAYPEATATVLTQSLVTNPAFVGQSLKGTQAATGEQTGTEPGSTHTLTITVHFDTHPEGQVTTASGTVTTPTEGCEEEPPVLDCDDSDYVPIGDECEEPPVEEPPTDDSSRSAECVGNALVIKTTDAKGNKTTKTINGHASCETSKPDAPPVTASQPTPPSVVVNEEGM